MYIIKHIVKTRKDLLNNKGFSHLEILLVIVVVAVIAVIGVYVIKKKNVAHAGSYEAWKINSKSYSGDWWGVKWVGPLNATLWACRTYIPAYGGINQVHAHYQTATYYYNGIPEGTYHGVYVVAPDNAKRQYNSAWDTHNNGTTFIMNFPAWQNHYFGAYLDDYSQRIYINANTLPNC